MWVWISIAGALGALARWCVAEWTRGLALSVPCGALVVNVVGCFAFGLLAQLAPSAISPQVRTCLLVGFLGAFTTFSSYAADVVAVAQEGRVAMAGALVLAHNAVGLAAFWFGQWLAR